ncbi:hypothetical protein ACFLWS_06130 [Chloroflexota bacterium]
MLRRKDNGTPEREVSLWLEKNGIPPQRYVSLQPSEKKALHDELSVPKRPTSDRQRRDLYRKLFFSDIAGRDSIDPVDFMPSEELDKIFIPPASSETLSYFEKF